MNFENKKIKVAAKCFLILMSSLCLTSCGNVKTDLAELSPYDYEKTEYETAEVMKGDLTPVTELSLKTEEDSTVLYEIDNELISRLFTDGLYFQGLEVSIGDEVSKGTVLISFASKELRTRLEGYRKEKSDNEALLKHYQNLAVTDVSSDYGTEINEVQRAIQVDNMYIEEISEKINSYCIKAKNDGVVTYINENLLNKEEESPVDDVMFAEGGLIEVSGVTDTFFAVCEDAGSFKIGERYTAQSDLGDYEMEIVNIEDDRITFKTDTKLAASDAKNMSMIIERPTLKNVIYVDKAAVYKGKDGFVAYVKDENGYYDIHKLKTGQTIGDYTVIEEGLSEGEEAALNR